MNLTPKQEKFCLEYLSTGNASEAYRRAYPKSLLWKSTSVERKACELSHNVKILARINGLQAKVEEKYIADKGRTIKRLLQGQEFDIRTLYHPDGKLKHPHELDDDAARAVVGVKYDKDGALLEYKIIDVKGCAELVGKHLKIFTDRLEVKHTLTLEHLVAGSVDEIN